MTLEEIDAALLDWAERLDVSGRSLLELDDSPAYQRLRRPASAFSGATAARLAPLLPRIDRLWAAQSSLSDLLHQAEHLRPALGHLWGRDAERRQLEFLLTGPAAQSPSPAYLPLSGPAPALTPDQLYAQMTQDLAAVQSAVAALAAAWNEAAAALARAGAEIAALEALAATLGIDLQPALETARREMTAQRLKADTDPLGAAGERFGADLFAFLASAQAALEAERQRRADLDTGLAQARALLASLGPLEASCRAVQAAHQAKIVAPLSVIPAIPRGLAEWLERIEAARRECQWKPAAVGVERWLAAAGSVQSSLTLFHAACAADLTRRDDLRGLLRALEAKAAAQAKRGAALDPSASAIAAEAEGLLHGGPTPLARAAELVSDYERRLAG